MTKHTATPAGVYIPCPGAPLGRVWVWRDTIEKQLAWVEKHGGRAQLTTGVTADRNELTEMLASIQQAFRESFEYDALREAQS